MRHPIRFRIQDKNDCVPTSTATLIELLHYLRGGKYKDAYFSPPLFKDFEKGMKEYCEAEDDEATNTSKALEWLELKGFIKESEFVPRRDVEKELKESPLLLTRKNFHGQSWGEDGFLKIPEGAKKKKVTHAVALLDQTDTYKSLQDSKIAREVYMDNETFDKVYISAWKLILNPVLNV